jgi:hypothetical protein
MHENVPTCFRSIQRLGGGGGGDPEEGGGGEQKVRNSQNFANLLL